MRRGCPSGDRGMVLVEPVTTGSATEEGGRGLQGITASDAVSLYGSCQLSTSTPPLVPTEALVLSEVAMWPVSCQPRVRSPWVELTGKLLFSADTEPFTPFATVMGPFLFSDVTVGGKTAILEKRGKKKNPILRRQEEAGSLVGHGVSKLTLGCPLWTSDMRGRSTCLSHYCRAGVNFS